jgi:predicted DNA binding CopG/RHH family protein
MKATNKKALEMPKFRNESTEADWWASRAGRGYAVQQAAATKRRGIKMAGSSLVEKLNKKRTVQIAIRLPAADLAQARRLAERKGIGYQTLVKMLVHEGLARTARQI